MPGEIHRILAEPQFRQPHEQWWQRVSDAVSHALGRFLAALLGSHGLGLASLLAVGLIVVVAALMAGRFAKGARRDPGISLSDSPGALRSPVEWDGEADRHEAAGEWREALRCRFRALVAEMGRRGYLEEVPGRTAGEYRRQVEQLAPGRSEPFRRASELFEGVWYGSQPVGPEQVALMRGWSAETLAAGDRSAVGRASSAHAIAGH